MDITNELRVIILYTCMYYANDSIETMPNSDSHCESKTNDSYSMNLGGMDHTIVERCYQCGKNIYQYDFTCGNTKYVNLQLAHITCNVSIPTVNQHNEVNFIH